MEYLLLGIAGLLGFYFYNQKQASEHLIFFPGNITEMGFQGATPLATLTIQVQNTSNSDIDIYSLAGSIYTNGILVGNVSNFSPVRIGRNSTAILPVTAQFLLIGVVNDIIRSFQTGSFKQDISVEGFVNAGGIQAPVKLTFKVGG